MTNYTNYLKMEQQLIEMEKTIEKLQTKNIYCGTEDFVEFFERVVETLGLDINYEVVTVDGEYEIEVAQ